MILFNIYKSVAASGEIPTGYHCKDATHLKWLPTLRYGLEFTQRSRGYYPRPKIIRTKTIYNLNKHIDPKYS